VTLISDPLVLLKLGLDAVLLICLLVLIVWLRRTPKKPDTRRLYKSAEDFLAASEDLAARFEQNLNDKRTLINDLVQSLDQRTAEMKALLQEANQLETQRQIKQAPASPAPGARAMLSEKEQDVLNLFRKGQSTTRIASQLRIPKGEVELILGLHKRF